ncbi:MAG: hypothetical protein ACFE0J_13240 [Elainellaceae cyanobacterium]
MTIRKTFRVHPQRLASSLVLTTVLVVGMGCASQSTRNDEEQPQISIESPAAPIDTDPADTERADADTPGNQTSTDESEMMSEETKATLREAIAPKFGVSADQVSIVRHSRETWQDGCLGLGKPEEFCTMMLVEGWQVEAQVGEQSKVFRTDLTGDVVRQVESGES